MPEPIDPSHSSRQIPIVLPRIPIRQELMAFPGTFQAFEGTFVVRFSGGLLSWNYSLKLLLFTKSRRCLATIALCSAMTRHVGEYPNRSRAHKYFIAVSTHNTMQTPCRKILTLIYPFS